MQVRHRFRFSYVLSTHQLDIFVFDHNQKKYTSSKHRSYGFSSSCSTSDLKKDRLRTKERSKQLYTKKRDSFSLLVFQSQSCQFLLPSHIHIHIHCLNFGHSSTAVTSSVKASVLFFPDLVLHSSKFKVQSSTLCTIYSFHKDFSFSHSNRIWVPT